MPMSDQTIERRELGKTGERVSVLGFGGVIVTNMYPETAANYVAEAFDRGINYFDVSPFYGNAQERLGPALAPYRDRCFLACKSRERDAAGLEAELEESLRLLQTDHVDLYQFHSLQDVESDVNALFAPGGAMEAAARAQKDGKLRFIGFSAHTEEAALAAMDAYDFDTVMFPFNYFSWNEENFGQRVLSRAREKEMGVIALKALAHRRWTKEEFKSFFREWPKCWYKPLDDRAKMAAALGFTLGLPVDAAIPPGHWDLFKTAMEIVAHGEHEAAAAAGADLAGLIGESEKAIFESV